MFLTALIAGLVLLRNFASDQFDRGKQAGGRSSSMIAGALNRALSASSNPQQTLDAFVAELNARDSGVIKFRRAGALLRRLDGIEPSATAGRAPAWFVHLCGCREMARHFPS